MNKTMFTLTVMAVAILIPGFVKGAAEVNNRLANRSVVSPRSSRNVGVENRNAAREDGRNYHAEANRLLSSGAQLTNEQRIYLDDLLRDANRRLRQVGLPRINSRHGAGARRRLNF